MPRWRLILSNVNSGKANMAIDQALWENFQSTGQPFLRFYRWCPATLSLGRFQHHDEGYYPSVCSCIDRVRRITGGGALWHDQELTYSLACSQEHLSLTSGVKGSFEKLTTFLLTAWKACGWSAFYAKETKATGLGKATVACFAGREEYDIIVNNKKLGGNAQARLRSKIFQHGSIPLEIDFAFLKRLFLPELSPCPTEVTSLKELGWSLGLEDMQDFLVKIFAQTMQVDLVEDTLTSKELERAQELEVERYGNPSWLYAKDMETRKNFLPF